jgi:hypothetical protein
MSKEWTRKTSDQTSVELEVNLPELFPGQQIPNSSELREAIGQEVIDIIRERTQDKEKSWTGRSFRDYSPEYVDSIDFKAYNKSKGEPNLTQSGDMLGLMTTLESKDPAKVKVGWNDTLQSEKAHGHITGAVGVKRDFFGLNNDEIKRIKDKFRDELPTAPETTEVNPQERAQGFIEGRVSIGQSSVARIIDLFFGPTEEG